MECEIAGGGVSRCFVLSSECALREDGGRE